LSLFDKQLVVVAGKGGVGRTTVAASLAVAAARRGKRVLLAQARSKERLGALLGGPKVMTDLVQVRPNLWAVNIFPEAALREYGILVLRSAMIEKAVLENKVSRAFLRAIPGLEDYSQIGKIWFHSMEREGGRPRFDLIVFDAPATGHVITLLQIPQAILDSVPDGPLTRDAKTIRAWLTDPVRSTALIVTLAEEMPVNESIELAGRLKTTIGMPVGPLVANQLYPPRFVTGPSARALDLLPEQTGDAGIDPLLLRSRIAMRRRQLNDRYLERLHEVLPLPQVLLPYLFAPEFGAREVEDLSQRLEGQLLAL
jgi:anion-transporting  ArsA/GET3 family ATPase